MASGRKQPGQGAVAVAASEPSVARRMWRVLRAVLYMLRRGVPSGRKLAMDLSLILHRGKIAGKALGDLLTSNHHHHRTAYAIDDDGGAGSFSCRALDPTLAVHEPSRRAPRRREVEFSCSTTPTAASGLGLLGGKRGRRSRRQQRGDDTGYSQYYYTYDAADVARVFELLNDDGLFGDDTPVASKTPATPAAYATPSPTRLLWAFARSPAVTGSNSKPAALHVAESPARAAPGGSSGDEGQAVDRKADEFIRRFYEQLRAQRSAASTPDYYAAASPYVSSSRRTTPRAIAAAASIA